MLQFFIKHANSSALFSFPGKLLADDVICLVENGFDPNYVDINHIPLILKAFKVDNDKLIRCLFRYGAQVTPLFEANLNPRQELVTFIEPDGSKMICYEELLEKLAPKIDEWIKDSTYQNNIILQELLSLVKAYQDYKKSLASTTIFTPKKTEVTVAADKNPDKNFSPPQ